MNKKNKFGFNYSYSSVSTFNQCPMRFKLQYLDREPIVQTEPLIKGNAVHDMVEELMTDISKNKKITIDLDKYEKKYQLELIHFLELETLRNDKFKNKAEYFDNVLEEKVFDDSITTVGKIDRVYKYWDGGYVLLDYKTGKVRDRNTYYPQLSLYTIIHNKLHPDKLITHWEIDWLTESKKYFIEPVNKIIMDEEYTKFIESIATIEKTTEFKCKMTPLCMWCSVLHVCPYQKLALEKFKYIADRKGLDVIHNIRVGVKNRNKIKGEVIYSKVMGTTFTDMAKLDIKDNDVLVLNREPTNEYDPNAIRVSWGVYKIGYIKKELAKDMAKAMDKGIYYNCFVHNITGGTIDKENKGINIRLVKKA